VVRSVLSSLGRMVTHIQTVVALLGCVFMAMSIAWRALGVMAQRLQHCQTCCQKLCTNVYSCHANWMIPFISVSHVRMTLHIHGPWTTLTCAMQPSSEDSRQLQVLLSALACAVQAPEKDGKQQYWVRQYGKKSMGCLKHQAHKKLAYIQTFCVLCLRLRQTLSSCTWGLQHLSKGI
jgi:hypothetical protein